MPESLIQILRVVVAGPVGAGISTFIETISEIQVVRTKHPATTAETQNLKPQATLAIDFGRLLLTPRMAVHLYGTRCQIRFDSMWDLLIQRAHGYVLLVAAHQPDQFEVACYIHRCLRERITAPFIVGVTHVDEKTAWSARDVLLALDLDWHNRPPVIAVNANDRRSVARSLLLLCQQMNPDETAHQQFSGQLPSAHQSYLSAPLH